MSLRRSRLRQSDDDLDPMSSVTNMTDIMLVLAVGFLIFAVMATGVEDILSDESLEEKQSDMQKEKVEIEPGEEVTDTIESIDSSSSGYEKTGTVYTDPKTGKKYMTSA